MAFPPIFNEYRADLVLYSAGAIVALWKWPKFPTRARVFYAIAAWAEANGDAAMERDRKKRQYAAEARQRAELPPAPPQEAE